MEHDSPTAVRPRVQPVAAGAQSTQRKPRSAVLAGAVAPHHGSTTPERRRELIEQLAYSFAELRGFAPGGELQDWLAAEAEVDQWLEGEHYSGD